MLICDDIKLDYSNVLIRPKRSTITSRFDVYMKRTYKFVHSKNEWTGIPIMASNMDTVGTPKMYKSLLEYSMITCPAKHYLKNDPTGFSTKYQDQHLCMMGGLEDIDALKTVAKSVSEFRNEKNSFIIITHYQRMLNYLEPDYIHVLMNGKIVKSGDKSLALSLEEKGYDWIDGQYDYKRYKQGC